MFKFFQLLARPFQRFVPQWIAVSTEPGKFVRQRVVLGDTTNFVRAAHFFATAVGFAFLAEVGMLGALGVSGGSEPFYWLAVILLALPFVLLAYLFVRLFAPISFKDSIHLSLYPIGAGLLTGAVIALLAALVVGIMVAGRLIPSVAVDFDTFDGTTMWWSHVKQQALNDCLIREFAIVKIVAAGLQEPFTRLRDPIGYLSFVRPLFVFVFMLVAAYFFMVAVERRKKLVFGLVVLAASVAVYAAGSMYILVKSESSVCREQLDETVKKRVKAPLAVWIAKDLDQVIRENASADDVFEFRVAAKDGSLVMSFYDKIPLMDNQKREAMQSARKSTYDLYCLPNGDWHSYDIHNIVRQFDSDGQQYDGFTMSSTDCPLPKGGCAANVALVQEIIQAHNRYALDNWNLSETVSLDGCDFVHSVKFKTPHPSVGIMTFARQSKSTLVPYCAEGYAG